MNYNDEILENKAFNFFKQLMYNIALSVCIVLLGVLVLVYGFGFQLFEVISNSQAPYFVRGDMVIVKKQDDYKVGDIILFKNEGMNISHRLIAIHKEADGTVYYICHGDNVQSADPTSEEVVVHWKKDAEYLEQYLAKYGTIRQENSEYPKNIQKPTKDQIGGKVVNHIDNLGSIVAFIKEHYLLVVAIVAGIWCVTNVVQNEIENKKMRRLL